LATAGLNNPNRIPSSDR